jgi:hypothetical protein
MCINECNWVGVFGGEGEKKDGFGGGQLKRVSEVRMRDPSGHNGYPVL